MIEPSRIWPGKCYVTRLDEICCVVEVKDGMVEYEVWGQGHYSTAPFAKLAIMRSPLAVFARSVVATVTHPDRARVGQRTRPMD